MTDAADTTSIEPANAEQLQPDTPTMSVLKKALPYMVVFGDIIIFVFEFIFLNTLIQLLLTNVSFIRQSRDSSVNACCLTQDGSFTNEWQQCVTCLITTDYISIAAGFLYVILWVLFVCYYFIWRYSIDITRLKIRPSKMVLFVGAVTLAGIALMIALQTKTNHWIYSLSNFEAISTDVKPEEASPNEYHISYSRIFQLFLGSPIVEEVVLRVILYSIINRRIRWPIGAMIGTNSIFAILHFFNAFQNTADWYTMFQMVAGFLLGMFYSTRFVLTGNILENTMLHVINNLSAILIPIQTKFSDIYPDFVLPIVLSLSVYLILLIRDVREIQRKSQ